MPNFNENQSAFNEMIRSAGALNPLGAVEYPTDAYSLCWCGSRKKWKFCHKGRQKMPQITFGQVQNKKEKFYRSGPCQHPDASTDTCSSSEAIQSHTVQRRGGLGAIAEKGHVYSIKKGISNVEKTKGNVDMEKLGVVKASVFPGYCNYHDTTLFKPVESVGAILDDMNGFLLSLRAVGYELAVKRAQLQAHIATREYVDFGRSFQEQAIFQNFLHLHQIGIEKGLSDVNECKSKFDSAYLSQDLNSFSLYGVVFDGILPFAVAGGFMPEFDFIGSVLQILGTEKSANQIALNVTELGGKTCAVFGWFGGRDCPAAKLVESFKNIPNQEKANALLLVSLEYLENIYFKPGWWENMPKELGYRLHKSINEGMPGKIRSPESLMEPNLNALKFDVLRTHERNSN